LSFHYFLAFSDFSLGALSTRHPPGERVTIPFHFQPFIYFRHEAFCQKCGFFVKKRSKKSKGVRRWRTPLEIRLSLPAVALREGGVLAAARPMYIAALRLVQDPFCCRLARLKLRTGVSGSFWIKQSGAIRTSTPSDTLQYARDAGVTQKFTSQF